MSQVKIKEPHLNTRRLRNITFMRKGDDILIIQNLRVIGKLVWEKRVIEKEQE
jgi:hypothetical protein